MGERGVAPKRTSERHTGKESADGPALQMGPSDLAAFGYDVDLAPLPPKPLDLRPVRTDEGKKLRVELDDVNGWHPFATALWDRLLTDPSRKWTGGAQMAVNMILCQTVSDWMMPRVVGWEEHVEGEESHKEPVFESGMKAAEVNALLAWCKQVGLDETSRLRLRKEITFYDGTPSAEATAAAGDGSAIAITRAEALRGHGTR